MEAFGEFVAASYAGLVRTAYLLTGDRGHAEDLVQQCLLAAYRTWPGIAEPEAYVRASMVRLATRWRARRWRGEVPTDPLPDVSPGPGAGEDPATAVPDAVLVRRALGTLPASQRAVLVLRYFDDRSEAEIAEILRCSVGTVKSRTSRALATLRAQGLLRESMSNQREVRHDRPRP